MRMSSEVDVKQSDLSAFHATHVGTACQRDLRKIAIHGLVLLQCQLSHVAESMPSSEGHLVAPDRAPIGRLESKRDRPAGEVTERERLTRG